MVPAFLVECGICTERSHLDGTSSGKEAPSHAREIGWKLTKQDGWVCPACLAIKPTT
jgi:hypothetical protein